MKRNIFPLLLILPAFLLFSCQTGNRIVTDTIKADSVTAIVKIESGKIAGYIDNGIYNFKGIPYAWAERFMPPEKPDSWEGVRSTRSYGPVCPINVTTMVLNDEMEFIQQHDFGYMNENCQNLNVWTPAINDGSKRPVMIWLHGGGYTAGSSRELPTYDGLNLSKTSDVVVVSVNHRLNVLGFLDLSGVSDRYRHSANAGMLDIVAALEWVQANISNFGGDPDNVTIFGQSGGGGKVGTLMQMPAAKGLFHKAIMQSGAAGELKDTSFTRMVGLEILSELGIAASEVEKINEVPFDKLLAAGNSAIKKTSQKMGSQGGLMGRLGWAPSIDGEDIPFQTGSPEALGMSKEIPLMIGTNKNEFLMSAFTPGAANASDEKVKEILVQRLGEQADDYIAFAEKYFPGTKPLTDILDIDVMFRPGSVMFANKKSSVEGGAPVYMYLFTWQSPILDRKMKAVHCMEIAFVFNNIARNREQSGDSREAYALADAMSHAWGRFAATGNPNGKGLPEWPQYNEADDAVMFFDNQCSVQYGYDQELMKFPSGR